VRSGATGVAEFCSVVAGELADGDTEFGTAGSTAERLYVGRGATLLGVLLLKLGIVLGFNA
jgi:hypothetical protein